jgi:putative PIN family toxin of toxin-antitoxin system
MYRVVLDPGVLIAALLSSKGAPAELLRRWLEGDYELIVSPKLLAELERVLPRPKFRKYFSEEEAREYVGLFRRLATLLLDPPEERSLTPDPGDDYLVSLARAAQVHFLVSGDPHLTELSDPQPTVLTPRAFLKKLSGQGVSY